ncbi:MAG: hypothetical protein E6Q33_02765 [Neisseriales bacterium]|nr:MAG: hypothetical protein E6Q33_02765 [Neisseriales bacterium]
MISTETNSLSYTGNGVTTTFAYTFPIQSNTWLKVYVDGVLKTLTTHYSVTGVNNSSGGNVVFTSAPSSGAKIVIARIGVDLKQLLNYIQGDQFPAKSHEMGLDKLTAIVQQLAYYVSRSVKLPDYESGNLTLGDLSSRRKKFMWFDADGNIQYVGDQPNTVLGFDESGNPSYETLPSGSPGDTFIQAGSGAVERIFQNKARDIVSVKDFGAVGDGVTDDGAAFRAAVEAVEAGGGGEVYVPKGIYRVKPADGDTTNIAVKVPGGVHILGAGAISTKICPAADNTIIFKMTGLNGGIYNLQIDNPSNTYSNVSGIRLAPVDEASTSVRSDVEFNNITNISIRGVAEAIVLKCGPTVDGSDSYCYYNTFTNIDIRNCTMGIWLKEPPTQPGSGNNRNTFISVRVGETGSNTGLQIDAGDTNSFIGCAFEGILSGTSPNTTPTAIKIAYNTVSYGCVRNKFFGLTVEACTRSIDNDNDLTEIYGYYDATNTYYSPNDRALAVDITADKLNMINAPIRSYTLRAETVCTGRDPDVARALGDFYTPAGNALVMSKSDSAGSAEMRVDTPGAYGYYTFYSAGTKQWSMGTQASGTTNITFFDSSDSAMFQIAPGASVKSMADNTYSLGTAPLRWSVVYAGTGTINTSDERQKEQIAEIDERVLKAWGKVNYRQFKFKDSVIKKNNKARLHFGVIAQQVKAAFESEGLDPFEYGILCYDEWEEQPEILSEDRKVVIPYLPAGDRYGVRYEEAMVLECAYLRGLNKIKHEDN